MVIVNERLWGFIAGLITGVPVGLLTMNHWSFPYVTTCAYLAGFVIGQRVARRRNVRAGVDYVMRMGGKDAFLDHIGREILTVWIPLDHDLSDHDRAFAKRIGEGMKSAIGKDAAYFVGVSTSSKQVGIAVGGREADAVLDAIRPYFKQHCPRGTFITRRYVHKRGDDKAAALHRWDRPKPLFEDDVIPETAWGF